MGVVTRTFPNSSKGKEVKNSLLNRTILERTTMEGDSPVDEKERASGVLLSTTGHVKSCGNLGGPPSKAKYFWPPIVNQYREGKVKRTLRGE